MDSKQNLRKLVADARYEFDHDHRMFGASASLRLPKVRTLLEGLARTPMQERDLPHLVTDAKTELDNDFRMFGASGRLRMPRLAALIDMLSEQ